MLLVFLSSFIVFIYNMIWVLHFVLEFSLSFTVYLRTGDRLFPASILQRLLQYLILLLQPSNTSLHILNPSRALLLLFLHHLLIPPMRILYFLLNKPSILNNSLHNFLQFFIFLHLRLPHRFHFLILMHELCIVIT